MLLSGLPGFNRKAADRGEALGRIGLDRLIRSYCSRRSLSEEFDTRDLKEVKALVDRPNLPSTTRSSKTKKIKV